MKVSRPTWFPKDSAGGGVTNGIEERGHLPLDSAGGGIWPLCHRKMEESKQVRDDPSASQALKTHQGRAQGADQAPLAAIARVSAAKSRNVDLGLVFADVLHEGSIDPRHE